MNETGSVSSFDEKRGLGEITADDGAVYPFHSTVLTDDSRTIAVGTKVQFEIVAGHRGHWEATAVAKL